MSEFDHQLACIDCGKEIGNGVRCSNCTVDCPECGAGFKTNADCENHKWSGHCAACGTLLGDFPKSSQPSKVTHRETTHHTQPHFTVEFTFELPIDGRKMKGGYLCDSCTITDLNKV